MPVLNCCRRALQGRGAGRLMSPKVGVIAELVDGAAGDRAEDALVARPAPGPWRTESFGSWSKAAFLRDHQVYCTSDARATAGVVGLPAEAIVKLLIAAPTCRAGSAGGQDRVAAVSQVEVTPRRSTPRLTRQPAGPRERIVIRRRRRRGNERALVGADEALGPLLNASRHPLGPCVRRP